VPRNLGKAGKRAILIDIAIAVRLIVERSVRSEKRHVKEERPLFVGLEELDGKIPDQIGLISFRFYRHTVLNELWVTVRATSAGDGAPVCEAGLRVLVVAHVPFTG
jgi:hypothetical protein